MRKPVRRGNTEYGYLLTPPENMAGPIAAYVYDNGDKARDLVVGSDFTSEDEARMAVLVYVDAQKARKGAANPQTETEHRS